MEAIDSVWGLCICIQVQLESEEPLLKLVQEMLEQMNEPLPLQGTITMETLYCAQFNDQNWYRCKVIELLPSQVRDPGNLITSYKFSILL